MAHSLPPRSGLPVRRVCKVRLGCPDVFRSIPKVIRAAYPRYLLGFPAYAIYISDIEDFLADLADVGHLGLERGGGMA